MLGGTTGILTHNAGSGAISITAGDVSASGGIGIVSAASAGETRITLGSGATVMASGGAGVSATSTGAAASISLRTAADATVASSITGSTNGIAMVTQGGNISITELASVTGNGGDGINAASGGGAITISAVGTVTGTGGRGIFAGSGGGDISIQGVGLLGGVSGTVSHGIHADARGTSRGRGGSVSIGSTTPIGAVSSGASSGDGIHARASGTAPIAITIDASAGTVEGADNGIVARSDGTGGVSITAADVTVRGIGSGISIGVNTYNYIRDNTDDAIGEISVTTTGTITSGGGGIRISSAGNGSIIVTSGAVTGTTASGIYAALSNFSGSSDISITSSGAVSGGTRGIEARVDGGGTISITAGDVTATGGIGIVSAANTGETRITLGSGATVMASGGAGVRARSYGGAAASISLRTAAEATEASSITGSTDGIIMLTQGADISITELASVTGNAGDGIDATSNGGDISIQGVGVTGGISGTAGVGISADARGGTGGSISIGTTTANGAITGSTSGIHAQTDGAAANSITIDTSTSAIAGGTLAGIYALNQGAGALSITTGDVTAANGIGILTVTQNGATITVNADATVSGSVGGSAIETRAREGDSPSTSNDDITIRGTVIGALWTFAGDDSVILERGSAMIGDVELGAGADSLILDTSAFSRLRGGEGDSDTLTLTHPNLVFEGSGTSDDTVFGFEILNINADNIRLEQQNIGLTTTNFNVGTTILTEALVSSNAIIASGAALEFANAASFTGNLGNAGTIGLNGESAGSALITGNLTLGTESNLEIDTLNANAIDVLTVSGNVTLGGTLILRRLDDNLVDKIITIIDGGTGLSGDFADIGGDGLIQGVLIDQRLFLDSVNFDVQILTTVGSLELVEGLSPNEFNVGTALFDDISIGAVPDLSSLALNIGEQADITSLKSTLDELTPTIITATVEVTQSKTAKFRDDMLDQPGSQSGEEGSTTAFSGLNAYPAVYLAAGPYSTAKPAMRNGPKLWGSVSYDRQSNDADFSNLGYKSDGFAYTIGVAGIGSGNWQFGITGSYANYDTSVLTSVPDTSSSRLLQLGAHTNIAVKKGPFGIDGRIDIAASYGDIKNDIVVIMPVTMPGLGGSQSGSVNSTTYGATLRYTLDGSHGKPWLIKPFVSIGYDHISQGDINFAGAENLNFAVANFSVDRYALGYGARLEKQWDKAAIRFGLTGYHYMGDTQTSLRTGFTEFGEAGPSFTTSGRNIKNYLQINAGASYNFGSGWSASADGLAGFGDIESYGGRFTISKRF